MFKKRFDNLTQSRKSFVLKELTAAGRSGFTLIELLIVITIIGILSSITLVSYNNVQQRSKISKAKADVNAINSAIKMMYADTKEYPFHFSADCGNPPSSSSIKADDEVPIVADSNSRKVGFSNNLVDKLDERMGLLKDDTSSFFNNWSGPYIDQIPQSDPWGVPYYWDGDRKCYKNANYSANNAACVGINYDINPIANRNYVLVRTVMSRGPDSKDNSNLDKSRASEVDDITSLVCQPKL